MQNPKRTPPLAIIDNLEHIGDPFRSTYSVVIPKSGEKIDGSAVDLEYVFKFLCSYNGSSATFNSYRREIERLLQWSWLIEKRSLCSLQREDIESFIRFCMKPPPAWIGLKNVTRFKTLSGIRVANSVWRPFVVSVSKSEFQQGKMVNQKDYCVSQAAIKVMFSVLSSFYGYLAQEGVTQNNPVSLIRQKSKFVRKSQVHAPVRRISTLQWDYVIENIEDMAKDDPVRHERTLFIMNCLFAMYLRISELVADERSTPTMGDFRKDRDGHWWFHVTGKGNKDRIVTVSDDMLKALKRYRNHLGMPPLPAINDPVPLIAKTRGKGSVTSTRQIRALVQESFDEAFRRMKDDGLAEEAQDLKSATVHWLRHTGISEDVKFRPREHVRDDAGHSTMQTTDRYIESDLRERHESGRFKRVREL